MRQFLRQRNTRLYALGQLLIVAGAWSIEATGSLLPMALAASAAVMLSMPLVRERYARFLASVRR
ncbi:hypothetical protein [Rhizobacter sp. LjRoot28]|jgi:hypothetical protein|uniref:hypothetical protein n=1 Tax=Rhizobacter sp. LjRoot28 TaxID=3342309 RepID=UPI003ECD1499